MLWKSTMLIGTQRNWALFARQQWQRQPDDAPNGKRGGDDAQDRRSVLRR